MTAVPPRPAATDATAGDELRGDCRGCGTAVDSYQSHVWGERKCCPDCDHRLPPALRDVLAAAARDAEKLKGLEEFAVDMINAPDDSAADWGVDLAYRLGLLDGPT